MWDVPKVRRPEGGRTGLGVEDVIRGRRPELLKIAKDFGATHLRVFGSVSRGQASETSDLDLLVTFRDGVDLFDHIHLERQLSRLLKRNVEVATETGLDPEVLAHALAEARPI